MPVICQNPAVEPPTWLKLGGIPPCPYRGLFAFKEEDAHLFFGRERFQKDLAQAVKRKPLVAVVGCSGSGKSSVVFAGLIPWLRQDTNVRWQIVSFRPGNNPIEALAAAIAPLVRKTIRYIETVFSQITLRFPKSIHAVTFEGFLLKVSAFIFAFTLEQAFL